MSDLAPDQADTADERDDELDRRLGTQAPALKELAIFLMESYSADGWGIAQFSTIADTEQRAVASDLLVSAVEGVQANLRDLALCEVDLLGLVGPNGRTMPGPDTTIDELIEMKRIHRTITDFARAFGSTLDCLAAIVIATLGLPRSIQAASAASLLTMPELLANAPAAQLEMRECVLACFAEHSEGEAPGWLAWVLELRDAVVHRGLLTNTWLTRPARSGARSGAKVAVRTSSPIQYLIRMEPHLRGKPWQPDMFSLSGRGTAEDALVWLPEPATRTVTEVKQRAVALVEAMAAISHEALVGDRAEWILPEASWRLERVTGKPRTERAAEFRGFDQEYPLPPPAEIRVHPRSAPRLVLAEQLRIAVEEREQA